jgi:ABC-type Fe3+/spermidine/putrescine transport system ATPase subunit
VGAEDGQAEVALAEGFTLRGRFGDGARPHPGAAVLVAMRKERVAIEKPGTGGAPGEIKAASFLGLQEEYIVAVHGVELRAIRPASGLRAGERVNVAIAPDDCIVFLKPADRQD